jgi:arylsulfatase A-like enzyme
MPDVDRPNVVVFFTDQQRWDTVGAYDSPLDLTPNLDDAAAGGTVVENAVTSQPVCGPARACLQTGQHATTHGVYTNAGTLPDGDHLLARQFDRAGDETGYVGKWHLAGTTTDPVPEGDRGGYRDYWRAADSLEHTGHPYEGVVYDGDDQRIEFDGYRVGALTDMAVDFVERDRDDPIPDAVADRTPPSKRRGGLRRSRGIGPRPPKPVGPTRPPGTTGGVVRGASRLLRHLRAPRRVLRPGAGSAVGGGDPRRDRRAVRL